MGVNIAARGGRTEGGKRETSSTVGRHCCVYWIRVRLYSYTFYRLMYARIFRVEGLQVTCKRTGGGFGVGIIIRVSNMIFYYPPQVKLYFKKLELFSYSSSCFVWQIEFYRFPNQFHETFDIITVVSRIFSMTRINTYYVCNEYSFFE